MPEWFLITVFFATYLMACVALAIVVCSIIKYLTNVAWMLLRKVFPQLPEEIEEHYEQTLERARRTRAEFVRVSNRDKHQLH